jgi:hypothetical protein
MPYVVSSNPKTLKLAGRVHLPKGVPTHVDKDQWKKCRADANTQHVMALGLVKLCPAPAKPGAKAPAAPVSKTDDGKKSSSGKK